MTRTASLRCIAGMIKPTLLVLAAGMGSRFGGLKQMAAVGPDGETLLDYAVHDALAAGFGKIVFVVRPDFAAEFSAKVVRRLPAGVPVDLAFQEVLGIPAGCQIAPDRTKPWGTGHAVMSARTQVREPFAVINADDYYGPDAYRKAVRFLSETQLAQWPIPGALVAFALGRTLSPHGAVSRGVCTVDEKGFLQRVEETTGVRAGPGGAIVAESGRTEGLRPDTPVSMNFFVFVPGIFSFLENQFRQFLESDGRNPTAEFYLPAAVALMIERNQAKITVMRSEDEWMGVTYPEDRQVVVERLAQLHAERVYRSPL